MGRRVFAFAVEPDGDIVVGGSFTEIAGESRNFIARLHANGELDTGFDSGRGPYGDVTTVRLLDDGRIMIGGNFDYVDGVWCPRVARLLNNGRLDLSFKSGYGIESLLAAQSDGRVLVGLSNHLARLLPDGGVDTTFARLDNAWGVSNALVQPDGRIVMHSRMSGAFSTLHRVMPDATRSSSVLSHSKVRRSLFS